VIACAWPLHLCVFIVTRSCMTIALDLSQMFVVRYQLIDFSEPSGAQKKTAEERKSKYTKVVAVLEFR